MDPVVTKLLNTITIPELTKIVGTFMEPRYPVETLKMMSELFSLKFQLNQLKKSLRIERKIKIERKRKNEDENQDENLDYFDRLWEENCKLEASLKPFILYVISNADIEEYIADKLLEFYMHT